MVVPYLAKGEFEDNPYFWQVISGIEAGASSENFHVMLTGISDSTDIGFAKERHLDGLVVIGANENSHHFQSILKLNVPCVFMDSYVTKTDVYQVNSNDKFGGYLGTKYLVSLGSMSRSSSSQGLRGKSRREAGWTTRGGWATNRPSQRQTSRTGRSW